MLFEYFCTLIQINIVQVLNLLKGYKTMLCLTYIFWQNNQTQHVVGFFFTFQYRICLNIDILFALFPDFILHKTFSHFTIIFLPYYLQINWLLIVKSNRCVCTFFFIRFPASALYNQWSPECKYKETYTR